MFLFFNIVDTILGFLIVFAPIFMIFSIMNFILLLKILKKLKTGVEK